MLRMMCCFAVLLIVGAAVVTPLLAQDRTQPPSTEEIRAATLRPLTEETHAWDSLLGKWNFSQQIHNPVEVNLKGSWTFSRMGDGFMIFDEFRTDNGAGRTLFLGETYRTYNPDKKTWAFEATQYATPKMGMKDGEWDAGTTRFENSDIIDEIPKGAEISRYRFYNIKRDRFSVVGEKSKDNGKTWVRTMDIECVRAQQ